MSNRLKDLTGARISSRGREILNNPALANEIVQKIIDQRHHLEQGESIRVDAKAYGSGELFISGSVAHTETNVAK